MIAWEQKPRWVNKAFGQTLIAIAAAACMGTAHAEVDISLSSDGQITVAGRTGDKVYFGSVDVDSDVVLVPLKGWEQGRSAGNGTGEPAPNSAGNGTGIPQPNSAGNGTGINSAGNGTGINSAGNGTGIDLEMDWGMAAVAMGCNEALVAIYRANEAGEVIEEEFSAIATDFCVE
jgi:hypothetical protein